MNVQRLESQLKQSHSSGSRKEEDFTRAIRSRDEAVKEAHKLLAHIEAVEERERQKVRAFLFDNTWYAEMRLDLNLKK